jgi:hypothetical protein
MGFIRKQRQRTFAVVTVKDGIQAIVSLGQNYEYPEGSLDPGYPEPVPLTPGEFYVDIEDKLVGGVTQATFREKNVPEFVGGVPTGWKTREKVSCEELEKPSGDGVLVGKARFRGPSNAPVVVSRSGSVVLAQSNPQSFDGAGVLELRYKVYGAGYSLTVSSPGGSAGTLEQAAAPGAF